MSRSITPYERFGALSPVADAFLREHVFGTYDTLSGLAYRYYGDWQLWRLIADRNEVADPRNIAVGTLLLIPKKPLEKGRYESG